MFSLTHGENGSGATSAGRRIGSSRELPTRLTTPADSARRNARLRASQVRVSQPEDVAERDADRAADLIAPGAAAGRGASRSPLAYAPPVVWDAIDSPGRLLDGHERPSAPGIDLAAVRLHEGGLADRSARALEAAAYTVGDDIVVGDGYDSHSAAGRRLLVHELTHVAQQRRLMFAAHDSAPGSGVSGLVAARQPLPARGAPGADPDEERARRLSRLLRDSPEAALTELKALSEAELDALDDKAAKVLRGADASLVHRGVEFVLYWRAHNQPAAKSGDMPKPDEGVSAPKADATVSGGTVAVRLGAGGGSGLGYTLTYTTSTPSTVADARWLQFAWREVVVERSVKGSRSPNRSPLEKRIGRPFGGSLFQYWLTTDPAHPNWNTDTSEKSSPFFEESTGTVTRTNTTLAMFDRPTAQTELVRQAFAGAPDRPLRVVERFHAAVYLVRGMNVLYRAEIDLSRPFLSPDDAPKLVATARGEPANAIAPEHRARLLRQFPDLDYLPGPALPAPHLRPEFGFIRDPLSEKAWAAKTNGRERLADVAQIAQANRIDDVWELTASAINETTEGKDGAHVEPGLNLAAKGKSTSGFVDEHKTFHAVLPANERGPLPRVAIVLSGDDLTPGRGEVFALATIRHEMEHARHCQLAIEWLQTWRDARPGKPFATWITTQPIDKDILPLLRTFTEGVAAVGKGDTELLAHVEGLVASAHRLPAAPDIALMRTGDFPAAIAELKMLGQPENSGWTSEARATERVHDLCCTSLDTTQRQTLIDWIDALLDPTLFKPKPGDKADEQTVKLIQQDFGTGNQPTAAKLKLKLLLEHLRAAAKKACPTEKPRSR